MPTRVRMRVLSAVAVLATVLVPTLVTNGAGAQDAVTHDAAAPTRTAAAAAITAVPLRSSYETSSRVLSRDIGVSVPLPDGHDLWLFGDTSVYTTNSSGSWANTGFIDGSTALEGRYTRGQVPSGAEIPKGLPVRFLPVPSNVYVPDGSRRSCVKSTGAAAFAARWPTGAVVLASNTSEVLVTYAEVCVTVPSVNAPRARAEGWGYMLYNWRVRRIALGPIDVFRPHGIGDALAPSHIFGWPNYVNGRLTMFSSSCTAQFVTCGAGHTWYVTPAHLGIPGDYKPVAMKTDGTSQWMPLSISVGQYPSGLRMIEVTTIGGNYNLLSAAKIGAPWHLIRSAVLPDCTPTLVGYCHGVEGHPELSTKSTLFISYKDPNSGPGGHMVVSAVPD
jgi:hypothetical protein